MYYYQRPNASAEFAKALVGLAESERNIYNARFSEQYNKSVFDAAMHCQKLSQAVDSCYSSGFDPSGFLQGVCEAYAQMLIKELIKS